MGSHHLLDFSSEFFCLARVEVCSFGPVFDCGEDDCSNDVCRLFVSESFPLGDGVYSVDFHCGFVNSVQVVHRARDPDSKISVWYVGAGDRNDIFSKLDGTE